MTATEPRLDLYEDNAGGLHICAVTDGSTEFDVYHHLELVKPSYAIGDALAILNGDIDDWTLDIDNDTSILTHPETRYIASFRRGGLDGGYWAMTGDAPHNAAREYLRLPDSE